jgi:protein tyrosine phosphatase (PTP) superfamily phosphohydrolase (DUF442 family)
MKTLSDIYHFLPLTENLLTAGQPTRQQFDQIAAAGVVTVINLALPNSSGVIPDEASLVKSLGMEYISIPVIWEDPKKSDLDQFCLVMQQRQQARIFVHCVANMRVSAFIALYRILFLGWDRISAFRDTSRIWDPFSDAVWAEFIRSTLAHSALDE